MRRAAQALGDDERAALVGLGQQQRELLAADARRLVDAALPLQRVGGDGLEGGVAGLVAEALVHRAEAVDVPDDDRHRPAGAHGALDLQLEHLLEGAAVDQPGERIGAVGVVDPRAKDAHARALAQHDDRQRERAGGRENRDEGAELLHPSGYRRERRVP